MFILSKILWMILSPGSLLALMLGGGLLAQRSARKGLQKTGTALCFFVLFCLLVIAVLPIGEWALLPLENRFSFEPPQKIEGIIVLGGDEETEVTETRGQPIAFESMNRYRMFAALAKKYPNAKLVYSGGPGKLHPTAHVKDSEVAREALRDMGVDVDRIVFESSSRNTWENAVFSANIVHPEGIWLLVTSAWHMPRAMGCFRKAGWNVDAAPTSYWTTGALDLTPAFRFDTQIHELTLALHEYFGLLSYALMGRTSSLWPG